MIEDDDTKVPVFDMRAAKKKFGPAVDTSPKARKSRQAAISNATDGRSLRATGRTEHLNFKATPATREMVDDAAKTLGIPKSLWLEQVIHEAHKILKGGRSA